MIHKNLEIVPIITDEQIRETAILADEIWHQHFVPLIGETQVDYMLEKFQSFPALKKQLSQGYEYFHLISENHLVGYTCIHAEDGKLFLSKLYLKKDVRGQHFSTRVLDFLKALCKERHLANIWLTCNRYNEHSLTVYDHLGFQRVNTQVADIGNGFVMDDYIMEMFL